MRLLLSSFVFLCALPAAAHDFWIEPSTYRPAAREAVTVRLLHGEHFRGEPVARNEKRIERFMLRDGNGERAVPGSTGDDPAGRIALAAPGLAVIGYRTRPLRHASMPAEKFEAYLREEGLERIMELRARRGETKKAATEMFSRSAKTLLLQPGQGPRYDEPLGLRFEIVPESDPHERAQTSITVRLLFDDQPLDGALVTAMHRDDSAAAASGRSDAAGRVTLPLAKHGVWLLKSVHMIEAPEGSGVDWESVWATLTFER